MKIGPVLLSICVLVAHTGCQELKGCDGPEPTEEEEGLAAQVLRSSHEVVPAYRLGAVGNALQQRLEPDAMIGLNEQESQCYREEWEVTQTPVALARFATLQVLNNPDTMEKLATKAQSLQCTESRKSYGHAMESLGALLEESYLLRAATSAYGIACSVGNKAVCGKKDGGGFQAVVVGDKQLDASSYFPFRRSPIVVRVMPGGIWVDGEPCGDEQGVVSPGPGHRFSAVTMDVEMVVRMTRRDAMASGHPALVRVLVVMDRRVTPPVARQVAMAVEEAAPQTYYYVETDTDEEKYLTDKWAFLQVFGAAR